MVAFYFIKRRLKMEKRKTLNSNSKMLTKLCFLVTNLLFLFFLLTSTSLIRKFEGLQKPRSHFQKQKKYNKQNLLFIHSASVSIFSSPKLKRQHRVPSIQFAIQKDKFSNLKNLLSLHKRVIHKPAHC